MEDFQTEVSGLCWGRVGGLRCAAVGGWPGREFCYFGVCDIFLLLKVSKWAAIE
jgi:hypothetical protein